MSKFMKVTIAVCIAVPLFASLAANPTLAEGKKNKKVVKKPVGEVCSYHPYRCEPIRGDVIVAEPKPEPKPEPAKKSFDAFVQSTNYTPITVRARH